VSPQLDASSAEVSVLMAQALQPHLQPFIQSLNQQCQAQLYWQLASSQRQLAPALALLWALPPSTPLTESDLQQLQLFACGQRPYAQVEVLLLQWLHQHIQQLPQHEAELWLKLMWQKHSMAELCQAGVAKGKAALQQLLQQSFSTWAKQCPTSAQ
jgi:tRNA(Met) cytidine acetyltransferase